MAIDLMYEVARELQAKKIESSKLPAKAKATKKDAGRNIFTTPPLKKGFGKWMADLQEAYDQYAPSDSKDKAQVDDSLSPVMQNLMERFRDGYQLLLEDTSAAFPARGFRKKLDAYLPHPESRRRKRTQDQPLFELVGFSHDALITFYEVAMRLLDMQRYLDASKAFFFLAAMSPQLPTFWQGLARCERSLDHFDDGLRAYRMALIADPSDPSVLMEAVRWCAESKEWQHGEWLLLDAIGFADEHPDDPSSADLKECALEGQEELALLKAA